MEEGDIPNHIFSGFCDHWARMNMMKRVLFVLVLGTIWIAPIVIAYSIADIDKWKDFRKGTVQTEGIVERVWYEKVGGPTTPGTAGPYAEVLYEIGGKQNVKIFIIKKEDYAVFKQRQDIRGEGSLGNVDLIYSPRNVDWITLSTDLPPRMGAIVFAAIWFLGILFLPLTGKIIISVMLIFVPKNQKL